MNAFVHGVLPHAETNASAQFAAWLASHCESIPESRCAVAVLGPPDTGPFAPVAFWPGAQTGTPQLADVAEQALEQRRVVTERLPPASFGLALPIEVDGHLHGVLALELTQRSDADLQATLQKLHLALVWAQTWLRREQATQTLSTEERLMAVLDLLGAVLEEARFEPACRSLVTELATRLQCDRVSFGVVRSGHAGVVALSHSAQIAKRMNLIHAVGAAMDEAIDQKAVIRYPSVSGDGIVVTRDHARLASEHGSGSVLTVPMTGSGKLVAALVFERAGQMPFDQGELELAQSIAAVVARVLELKQQNERALLLRITDAGAQQIGRLIGPRYMKRKLAAMVLIAATGLLGFTDGDYRVTAPATLEGAVRRTLAAPFDGYVATAPGRAGDVVRSGSVLATLDDSDIRLERLKWASQYAQFVKQHQEAVANRDRAKAQIVQAQYEQAQAQVTLLDAQLRRVTVSAPFDGVIVKGDLSQSLGSAVKRGDALFEITPLKAYRVTVNVDERDIADVASGRKGVLILSSITQESFPFTVGNVTSVTTAREGKNYFRVEATLENATDRLRPGMEGVAKIDVEPRRLIWIWTHRMVGWLQLFIWNYWP